MICFGILDKNHQFSLSYQVPIVIPEVFLESGKKLLSLLDGVMGTLGNKIMTKLTDYILTKEHSN